MGTYPGGNIIRVTPTVIEDSAYADGDVLFVATEIPNAVSYRGGVSKLYATYLIDEDSQATKLHLIFTQKATDFGTIDATANVSYDNVVASNFLGILKVDDNAQTAGDLDNFTVKESQSLSGPNDGFRPIILQAEGGSTSVYVQAVIYDGTPTFTNTDSLQLVFHIEYLG